MNARPPDGSDEPEAVDQVMLAVLSNSRARCHSFVGGPGTAARRLGGGQAHVR